MRLNRALASRCECALQAASTNHKWLAEKSSVCGQSGKQGRQPAHQLATVGAQAGVRKASGHSSCCAHRSNSATYTRPSLEVNTSFSIISSIA